MHRKYIHFFSTIIPLGIYLTPPEFYQPVLLVLALIAFMIEFLRFYSENFRSFFNRLFGYMLKEEENTHKFTGATFVLLSSFILGYLFPKEIAITSLLYLTLGDPLAGLIGNKLGKRKFFGRKTLEGFLTMVLVGFLINLYFLDLSLYLKIFISFCGGIIEAIELPIDDNLTLPLGMAILIWGLTKLT